MARATPLFLHQASEFEYLEVLRDGGTADRKAAGELADGGRPAPEQVDEGLTGGIGERTEHLPSVSHTLR